MKTVNRRHIIRQLQLDLTGKDAHRGVTLTYAWLANQFGHFALGYIPASILCTAIIPNGPALQIAVWVSFFWLCFEAINLLVPLLRGKKHGGAKRMPVQYVFRPDWPHLVFDTVTDLLFFWTGAFTAAVVDEGSQTALLVMVALFLLLLYPSYYWYVSRIYLQNAACPAFMRLSQWNLPISAADKETIARFLKESRGGRHLLVFGGAGSGKTSIGLALAHETALQRRACTYMPAMKLLAQFTLTDTAIQEQQNGGWSWRNAELLLIDDLHPGNPVMDDFIEVERFFNHLNHPALGALNRQALVNKSVIWILGIEGYRRNIQLHWEARLQQMGVAAADIFSIHLPDHHPAPQPVRQKAITAQGSI